MTGTTPPDSAGPTITPERNQAALDDLVQLLDLEAIEVNIFRGASTDEERVRVFGGQVAGQALVAAARTIDEPGRLVHSLHAYFLRPGDPKLPILYEVDRIRDGRSFATRRVVAIQHGKAIFNLQASFHDDEPGGPDHQTKMDDGLTPPLPHRRVVALPAARGVNRRRPRLGGRRVVHHRRSPRGERRARRSRSVHPMTPLTPSRRASGRCMIAPVAAAALILGACASDDTEADTSGADDTPVIEPAPETDDTAGDTTVPPAAPAPAPADADPDESTGTDLEPDPSADLPTARPDQVTPPTTVPGPLPTPSVQLIDEAAYDQPIDATVRPGDVRMIVIQRGGEVIASDAESSVTLFDVADIAESNGPGFTNGGGEQGLLGLAFHPTEPFAYVHFSAADGATVVAELAIDPTTAEADPASYRELLEIEQPFGNHNGGELEFGPDDLLYLGLGDGGSADDPLRASLDPSTPLGSILRFDPTPSGDEPITVPADNPFVGVDGANPLIWSVGLRNPWKFSFDAVTGDLWIADVGQNEFEEINRAPADPSTGLDAGRGLDFGWSAFEAYEPFNSDQASPDHTPPVAAYSHDGGACSVSGGVVARSSSYADLNGWYIYGDFCSGQLWALDTTSIPADPSPENQPTIVEIGFVPGLTSVVTGPDGDIYTVSINGSVSRLAPA